MTTINNRFNDIFRVQFIYRLYNRLPYQVRVYNSKVNDLFYGQLYNQLSSRLSDEIYGQLAYLKP